MEEKPKLPPPCFFEQRALHFYYAPRKLWSWHWLILQSLQAKCFQEIFLMESQSESLLKCKKGAHKPRQAPSSPSLNVVVGIFFLVGLSGPKLAAVLCWWVTSGMHYTFIIPLPYFAIPGMVLQGKWWPGME